MIILSPVLFHCKKKHNQIIKKGILPVESWTGMLSPCGRPASTARLGMFVFRTQDRCQSGACFVLQRPVLRDMPEA